MGSKINKIKINFIVDLVMFAALMTMAGIGLLIKYVLIPGYKRNIIYGEDVELFYQGLDRHQWGTIHLTVSFIFLFLLILHITLHWKQIVSIYNRMIPKKNLRNVLATLFISITMLSGILPFMIQPQLKRQILHKHVREIKLKTSEEINRLSESYNSGANRVNSSNKGSDAIHEHNNNVTVEVYGYMTLQQVSDFYEIPIDELTEIIHVPKDASNEKLGRLRKQYTFHLSELKKYIKSRIQD